MDRDAYLQHQDALQMLLSVLSGLDLPAFLAAIDRAQNFGAVIDPTLYRAAGERMDLVRRHAEALMPAWRAARVAVDAAEAERARRAG